MTWLARVWTWGARTPFFVINFYFLDFLKLIVVVISSIVVTGKDGYKKSTALVEYLEIQGKTCLNHVTMVYEIIKNTSLAQSSKNIRILGSRI